MGRVNNEGIKKIKGRNILLLNSDILLLLNSVKILSDYLYTHTSHPIAVGNVSGASMMVSRKVLDEVGIFDPDFFMYSE